MTSHPDRRAQDLEWRGAQDPARRPPTTTLADPTGSAYGQRKEAARSISLMRGMVVDSVSYLHAYRVHPENLATPIICTLGAQTSLSPIGARQLNTLVPGTPVWFAKSPQADFGVIVFVEPAPGDDPALALSDWIHMASRCGFHVDRAHEAVLRSANRGFLQDWSSGRPVDSVPVGEYGAITETGLKLTLDSFMAQLSAGEASGLFVFYHDELVRLAGVNLEQFSAVHLERFKDDEGEGLIYRGWTPYPWEQLGTLKPDVAAAREVSADDVQNDKPAYGSLEPVEDDQIPFHRRVFYGGYLGQGGKDLVLAPPTSEDAEILRASAEASDQLPIGVIEEQRTLAGTYALRAAKGIHLVKHATIPAPHPKARPEDLTGDTPENYRPAGRGENGAEHKVVAEIPPSDDVDPYQKVAGLADTLALNRNWEGAHPFAYHEKDWTLPEEGDLPTAESYEPPAIEKLGDEFSLPLPKSVTIKVDERYGGVTIYLGEASINLGDDGSVVQRDAWGSEIAMTGGNIYINPAGDLHVRAGRNIVHWAGRDAIIRARGCAEISTADSDVRIKSQRNLHMLAGNSGEGGVMIESKGVDATEYIDKVGTDVVSGGIQLKATNGSLVAYSTNLYFRSLNAGTLYFDADRGNGRILQLCQSSERYCAISATDYFGPPGKVTASNSYNAFENKFGGSVISNGMFLATGGLILRGDINVIQGHIYTETSRSFQGLVGDYGPNSTATAAFKDLIQGQVKTIRATNADASKQYTGPLTETYYKEGQAGNPKTVDQIGFSFRNTRQYRAEGFVAWETSWQQILRETQTVTDRWVEPAVKIGGVETHPYPGTDRLVKDPAFYQQALSLYDVEKGVAKPRGENREAYEDPAYAELTPVPLDGNYPVVDATPADDGEDTEGNSDGEPTD